MIRNNKVDVVHKAEGIIYAISWCGSLLAWANDTGIKVIDTNSFERVAYIAKPKSNSFPDQYRCCLTWEGEDKLIIGWGSMVQVIGFRYFDKENIVGATRYSESLTQYV